MDPPTVVSEGILYQKDKRRGKLGRGAKSRWRSYLRGLVAYPSEPSSESFRDMAHRIDLSVPRLRASKNEEISLAPKKAAGRNDSSEQRVELKSLGSHCHVITRRVSCFEGQKAPALRAPPSPAQGLFFRRLIWRPHGVLAGFRSYWLDLIFRVVCFQAVGYPDSNSAPAFLCLGPVNPEALAHHTPGPFSWPPQLAASF